MKRDSAPLIGIAATRGKVGLSQREIARYLGISKAAVSMAEVGRRKLPVSALLKLAHLEIAIALAMESNAYSRKEITKELAETERHDTVILRDIKCEARIFRLSIVLKKMAEKHNKIEAELKLFDQIINNEPADQNVLDKNLIHIKRDQLHRQLATCNLTKQHFLESKIALLRAESHLNKGVKQVI